MLQFLETYLFHLRADLHSFKLLLIQNPDVTLAIAVAMLLILFPSWISGLWKRALSRSESLHNELIAYHLDRVASALERIARPQRPEMEFRSAQSDCAVGAEQEIAQRPGVGSMFGFGGRVRLANPLYRPK